MIEGYWEYVGGVVAAVGSRTDPSHGFPPRKDGEFRGHTAQFDTLNIIKITEKL